MAQEYVSGTFAADGQSSSVLCKSSALVLVGYSGAATFGSGTVKVQFRGPDNQWYTSSEAIASSDVKVLNIGVPTEIRLSLSGSTAPTIGYAIQSDVTSYRD